VSGPRSPTIGLDRQRDSAVQSPLRQIGSEEDDVSLKLVITLLVAASLLGGAVGAGVALLVDHGKVGPRGPQGVKGPPGPPGIYADVGVLESRIAGLDRRLSRLERRLRD
jgi:hypothetical protein